MSKISVIIPVYNVEKYLNRSMECLKNQTLKDMEFIFIDDGSTDGSSQILSEYERNDERFKIIRLEQNHGAAYARNKGLEIAQGEYIGFIDPDDSIDLNYYEELYKRAKEQDYDVVKCKRKVINTDGTVKESTLNNLADKHRYFFAYEWTTGIFKKQLIDKNNIKFYNLTIGEDTLFLNEVMMASKNFSIAENVFYYYHKRDGSLLDYSENSLKKAKDLISSVKIQITNINKSGFFEENKYYYNQYVSRKMSTIMTKFFLPNSNRIKYAYSKAIIDIFYMHKDPEYFAKHFKFKRLFKFIENKDYKGLFYKLKSFDSYADIVGNNLLQNIFSVKNIYRGNKKYKRITVLWAKFDIKMSKYPVLKTYYYTDNYNFGDILNIRLLNFFKYDIECKDKYNSNILAIGSLLHRFTKNKLNTKDKIKLAISRPLVIYGSGFIKDDSVKKEFIRKLDVKAVRGYYTLERLKKMKNVKIADNVAIGDPGLLVSKFYNTEDIEKTYTLGIIPHYVDKDSPYLSNIKVKNSIILDVQQEPEKLIKKIAQCEYIISSAMHGLIAADSLGIPNIRMILSDKVIGGDYKFNDYYSVFGIKEHPKINLTKEIFTEENLKELKENYKIKKEQVTEIQEELINSFPYKRGK